MTLNTTTHRFACGLEILEEIHTENVEHARSFGVMRNLGSQPIACATPIALGALLRQRIGHR